jgi:hypothetical protein
MKLLSIDVGIKNLAYCLINKETNTNEILLWDVINLCGSVPDCSSTACKKKAKFSIANSKHNFCPTHAKKSSLIIPTAVISLKKIKKMKLVDLQKVVKDYNIPLDETVKKKDDIFTIVMQYMEKNMLQSVTTTGANDMDLIQIGVAMRDAFNKELADHLSTIDEIVIENQISPIANRMKTLQGMIAQYFIMNNKTKITFVSAANKLKEYSEADTSSYASRKKEGIKITHSILTEKHTKWLPHFNQHKKKDDLADSFLQGNWYLNKK